MSTEEVRHLAEVFKNTLQPEKETRHKAEAELSRLAMTRVDYASGVLQVVASAVFPLEIRLAAAVNFKNHVKRYWDPDDVAGSAMTVSEDEKVRIRSLLVEVMVYTPAEVRLQVAEALNLVSMKDFPQKWPNLIPSLVEQLSAQDVSVSRGVLETANSVFKRFRNTYMSAEVSHALEVSQKGMLKPLLAVLRFLTTQLSNATKPQIEEVCVCVRLIFRIFYSLNVFGITEMMEVDLKEWMRHLFTYLEFKSPLLHEVSIDTISPLDNMKAAVCDILNLFIQINEEDFAEYVEQFVGAVWTVLSTITLNPGQDKLVVAAVAFLTSVAKGPYVQIFKQENVLRQIFTAVIIPSLKLREDDLELFEMNGIDYIRRDTEGSDSDTRRRAAADLVRVLADQFPEEVTHLCTSYIETLLEEYRHNPVDNILAKDCAIFMVVTLTVKGKTVSMGATTVNSLVPLTQFWKDQIEPEIVAASGVNQAPLLKADALKFLTTFRIHVPRETLIAVFPSIVNLLGAECFVVHSYAATLIERLIVLSENKTSILLKQDLMPHLQPLLENLFGAFKFPDSAENPYLMKCVMRVIEFIDADIVPVAQICLQTLAHKLLEVCQNPQGPAFNHYLFEAVAALVRNSTEQGAIDLDKMQQIIFPAFDVVLQKDVQEFHPYVFQILAEFIDLRPVPLPDVYHAVVERSLTPFLWERQGNVPALTKLIRAFIRKAPDAIVQKGNLENVLGVFQRLNSLKAVDEYGLLILEDVYRCFSEGALKRYQSTIWSLLFQRLEKARTAKYTKAFIRFVSSVILHVGVIELADMLEGIQAGIFRLLLQQIWIPSFNSIKEEPARRICCCALIKILTEFRSFATSCPEEWARLLEVLTNHLEGSSTENLPGDVPEPEMDDFAGYAAAFAQLRNAKLSFEIKERCTDEPKLINALAALNSAMTNQLEPIIRQHVNQETKQKLMFFVTSGNH